MIQIDIPSYNQLKRKYKVMTTTIKEVINNPKLHNLECVVLEKKPDIIPPHKPKKHKKSKFDLIMERLDKYDELFKAHGWIK